jgi:DnaJ-class molecular chaperone
MSNGSRSAGTGPAGEPKLEPGDEAEPGTAGTGENICPECQGTGLVANVPCRNCGGTGVIIEGIGGG